MKTLILSDVHGNLPALETLIARGEPVDQWLCLGDTVNYAPWGNECVQIIDALPNSLSIMGNHEEYFLAGKYAGKSSIGQAFFRHCYANFSEIERIAKFSDSIPLGDFLCVHTLEGKYLFHDSPIEIDRNYIIGHSHQQYQVERSGFQLVNPGSLGQDRRYINRANYAIYDDESRTFELKNFLFDVGLVLSEMRACDYPQECIDYYLSKEQL